MSSKRAKQHESDVIVNSGHRKWLKSWDHQGFGSKWRMEASGRPPKFRTRAYNRAKELEDEIMREKIQQSLKTEPLGLLQFVKAPFEQSRYKDIFRGERGLWKD